MPKPKSKFSDVLPCVSSLFHLIPDLLRTRMPHQGTLQGILWEIILLAFVWKSHPNAPIHLWAAALSPNPSSLVFGSKHASQGNYLFKPSKHHLLPWEFGDNSIINLFLFFPFFSALLITQYSQDSYLSLLKRSCTLQQQCGSTGEARIIFLIDLGRGEQWFPLTDFH